MIDTVAKRSAALQSGFSRATKVPSGTINQIERGYTLGLYTFTYVAVSSQIWTITFATSRQKLTGGLQASCFTGGLAVSQLTGGLAVSLSALPTLPVGTGFLVNSSGEYLVDSNGDYLIASV